MKFTLRRRYIRSSRISSC